MIKMPTTIHARPSNGSDSTLVQAGRQTLDVGNGTNNQWPGLLKVVIGLSIGHVVLLAVIAAVLGSFVSSHVRLRKYRIVLFFKVVRTNVSSFGSGYPLIFT